MSNKAAPPSPFDRAFLSNDPDAGQLILVRHGQQEWPDPETATIGDWVDPPLSELGRRQAQAVGEYLSTEAITAVYSSQLKRAFDTGNSIAEGLGLTNTAIAELEEIQIYGKLPADKRASDLLGETIVNGARERFYQTRSWDSYPQSEASIDFRRRTGAAIEGILASHPGETIAVACHGGVINAYVGEVLNIGVDMFYRPVHASIHRLRFKDGVRAIDSLNEQRFLSDSQLLSD